MDGDEIFSEAEFVCCNDHFQTEYKGMSSFLHIYEWYEQEKEDMFYDSVCGIPIFQAPKGRSRADWYKEMSISGFPIFREQEIFKENVVIKDDGEILSTCGTHIGYNLPDKKGDRYTANIVCILATEDQKDVYEKFQLEEKTYQQREASRLIGYEQEAAAAEEGTTEEE